MHILFSIYCIVYYFALWILKCTLMYILVLHLLCANNTIPFTYVQDPATKYHGHLLLAHIISKFAIHKKIVLQVCYWKFSLKSISFNKINDAMVVIPILSKYVSPEFLIWFIVFSWNTQQRQLRIKTTFFICVYRFSIVC
jgi:hypothetical protein